MENPTDGWEGQRYDFLLSWRARGRAQIKVEGDVTVKNVSLPVVLYLLVFGYRMRCSCGQCAYAELPGDSSVAVGTMVCVGNESGHPGIILPWFLGVPLC